MTSAPAFTLQELLIARMALEFCGERIATGASVLSDIAARVAKHLYQPDLLIVGGSYAHFDCAAQAKGFNEEWFNEGSARMWLGWPEVFDIIRQGKFQIWINPAQIDKRGNTNISVIGDWARPSTQLVGARGIPDDLWGVDRFLYHVRQHSKRSFVEKVDFVCGLGFGPLRDQLSLTTGVPGTVVSDLGVFGWSSNGQMVIESLHPGVSLETLRDKTGFDWGPVNESSLPRTQPPTADELECIRTVTDPFNWRRLDDPNRTPETLMELMSEEAERLADHGQPLSDRKAPMEVGGDVE